jgi:diacylglycerol kinase family enzyme
MRNAVLVVNPCAGRGSGARLAPAVVRELRRLGVDAEMRLTARPRHAIELVATAIADGASEVLVAGGDGTIFEAVNGMLAAGPTRSTLGIVPIGTGNDFVKMLGLTDWRVACARIAAGRSRPVDIGRCGTHYFANGVGVGFDAQVAHFANGIRWLSGTPVYALALLNVLAFDYRRPQLRITHDNGASRWSQSPTGVATAALSMSPRWPRSTTGCWSWWWPKGCRGRESSDSCRGCSRGPISTIRRSPRCDPGACASPPRRRWSCMPTARSSTPPRPRSRSN